MTGTQSYEQRYHNMAQEIIVSNPDKAYLSGFRYFLGNLSPATTYRYITHVVGFVSKIDKAVDKITLDDYTWYLGQIRGLSSSYQIQVYTALKWFSNYLAASEVNAKNPMQYINRPKFKETQETKEKREIGYLEKKEIKTYLKSVENGSGNQRARALQENWKERDLCIIMLLLTTGMRRSALYKLDVSNIDLEKEKLVTVDKGDKIQEYILSSEMMDCLRLWLDKRNEILNGKDENALFISKLRSRLSDQGISCIVSKYAENIKGKHITPHKLRATYGTQLYNQTKDLYFVQQCMNHANPKTTEIYIRGQQNESRRRAADIMSKFTES